MENLTQLIGSVNPLLSQAIAQNPWLLPLIIAQVLFKLILDPIALYFAGKNKSKLWFILLFFCLFILNDFGIVALVYIIFQRSKNNSSRKASKKRKR